MNNLLTSVALLLTVAMLSAPVSAQLSPQGAKPSSEQVKVMQEALKELKPLYEEAFVNNDVDESDSLDKEELTEFYVALWKAKFKVLVEGGVLADQSFEAELSEMKEKLEQNKDEEFKKTDTDESGDISLGEILKRNFGDAYTGEDEEEEPESTSVKDEVNDTLDSQESAPKSLHESSHTARQISIQRNMHL